MNAAIYRGVKGGWGLRLLGGAAVWLCCGSMAVSASVASSDFQRFKVILDRRPFGAAPSEDERVPPPAPPSPPPEFTANLKMCAITDRGGRVRVGFMDNSAKPSRTYFLFVGDVENGFELVSADYEAERAVLKKDGFEIAISMSGGSGLASEGAKPSEPGQLARSNRRNLPPRSVPAPSRLTREQYLEEQEAGLRGMPSAPQAALSQNQNQPSMDEMPPEIRELAMRKYNMELIRAQGEMGLPLPIPLTDEEDAILVEEGKLPPASLPAP